MRRYNRLSASIDKEPFQPKPAAIFPHSKRKVVYQSLNIYHIYQWWFIIGKLIRCICTEQSTFTTSCHNWQIAISPSQKNSLLKIFLIQWIYSIFTSSHYLGSIAALHRQNMTSLTNQEALVCGLQMKVV